MSSPATLELERTRGAVAVSQRGRGAELKNSAHLLKQTQGGGGSLLEGVLDEVVYAGIIV